MNLFYLILAMLPPVELKESPKAPIIYRSIIRPETIGPFYIDGEEVLGTVIADNEEMIFDEKGEFQGESVWTFYKMERSEVASNGMTVWIYMGAISEEVLWGYYNYRGGYLSEDQAEWPQREFLWWTKKRRGTATTVQQAIRGMLSN